MKGNKTVCDWFSTVRNGSMTLFFALILTLVFSLFFSLLEAARVQGLKQLAKRSVLLELESAFGEYQINLWKDYHLLFLDGGNASGEWDPALLEGNWMEENSLAQKGTGFYQLALRSLELSGYSLATDSYGAAFEKQACRAIQEQLAVKAAEALKQKLKQGEDLAKGSSEIDQKWNMAKDAMEEAESLEQEKEDIDDEENNEKESLELEDQKQEDLYIDTRELPENPVDGVDLLKSSAILFHVVENPSEISAKSIRLQDTLRQRDIKRGNLDSPQSAALDKLCFLQYLNHYFTCKTGKGEAKAAEHALDYELEYCVAGKASDQENLEKTVKELLLIRETGNFATIMQDGKKRALAMEIATVAVGFTGIALLIQAVQIGVLLAWSYIESVLDVRCLLSGGSVPLVKKVNQWKSDISLGEEVLEKKEEKSESHKEGFDYREYLQILLLLVKEETLVQRAMDIVEQNVRLITPSFRMNHQIHGMRLEGLYAAQPLFMKFITNAKSKEGSYHFKQSKIDFYLSYDE